MKEHKKIIISIVIIIVLALVLPLPKCIKVTLKGMEYPDKQIEVTATINALVSGQVSFKKTSLWRYNSRLNQICFGSFGFEPKFKRFLVGDELNGKFYVFYDDEFSYEETIEYFEFFWR